MPEASKGDRTMLSQSNQSSQEQSPERDTGYVSAPPAVSLPKGGGAIQGIGEKFSMNPVTGTGSLSIPILVSPGRSGFSPQLSLSYDSGSGNGPFGLGWNFSVPSITRKTQKGLPQYRDSAESDIFLLSGAEDLVPAYVQLDDDWVRDVSDVTPETVLGDWLPASARESVLSSFPETGTYIVQRYRPRIEGFFARIERWQRQETGDIHWRSVTKDNVTSVYGKDSNSRISDPEDTSRVFEWLLCESYDDKGNVIRYEYKPEDAANVDASLPQEKNRLADGHSYTNRYLKRIFYGNQAPYQRGDWLFQVVLDYGEHDSESPTPEDVQPWPHRPDAFSTFRSRFEIRTQRLCQRVLMFHRFDETEDIDAAGKDWYLVRSTDFTYEPDPIATYLVAATQTGYAWTENDGGRYQRRSYPPLSLHYDRPELNDQIQRIDAKSLENLPTGLDGARYQWLDLDGEGISGILTEQAEGWFYKANLGSGQFAPVQAVATKPSVAVLQDNQHRFMDLAGDGQQDLVLLNRGLTGFYERNHDQTWERFRAFQTMPNVNWADPNLRLIDLNGDGHADILISEESVFVWYPSEAEGGFGASNLARKLKDEERGPALVFADGTQSVYLSDMTGDGLNDIVRIRNRQVCYWPNLGYGQFGAKVTMDGAPHFDHPELFDQSRIRLADIDGSGTTDILYLGRDAVRLWFNQAGNSWSEAQLLSSFPQVDNLTSVQTVDLFGNGTACLVWSSPLPGHAGRQMQYIDLMGGQKPHLLTGIKNNLGSETQLTYRASTYFYLEDKKAGTPWITKIPFPVHVVERVETLDHLSGNRFVSRYRYRHGYFDGEEREFRGFSFVEQKDTVSFEIFQAGGGTNTDQALHVPPVVTKTWFHTGVYLDREHISDFFARTEYYRASQSDETEGESESVESEGEEREPEFKETLLDDTILPSDLTVQEEREACRALRGRPLRQEVYARDGTDKADHPYTVTESNYEIRRVQPRQPGDRPERYGVFFVHPRESLAYHYERNPADPRIAHQMTLEVDGFGNVLQSVAIAYPRQEPEHPEQTQPYITYTKNRVTNKSEAPTWYRIGLPIETSTYEITGLDGKDFPYGLEDVRAEIQSLFADPATELSYHTFPNDSRQRRLVQQVQTLYRPNDQANTLDPACLALGEVESLALPCESFKLAFTQDLMTSIYEGKLSSDELDTLLREEGRYVEREGRWWIPSGRQSFEPDRFYISQETQDPFGEQFRMTYDDYSLMVKETEDPLGNRVEVRNNYRVLQPEQITDPNQNRSEVKFDVLGMVAGTAVMGKPDQDRGDSLTGFRTELTREDLQAFMADPLGQAAALLGTATTRIIYDLDRYADAEQPIYAATLAREKHGSDLGPDEQSRVQVSFLYSDGFGRELQSKVQAEPGDAPVRDAEGVLRCDQNLQHTNPRWTGTGRTIYNNKGKPVKQYEPYFSPTHLYEDEDDLVQCGVTPILFYDPLQRVIATLHPNHTYEKVVFSPWRQETWDVNDTLIPDIREDFKADQDIGGYFEHLDEADYLPTWYTRHRESTQPFENQAAEKAAAHAGTPSVVHLDTLGRPFLTLAHNRFESDGEVKEEDYQTRVQLDIEGQQLSIQDARGNQVMIYAQFSRHGETGEISLQTRGYDLLGNSLYTHSMDAGERWMLNNVAGNPIRGWDGRGHTIRTEYDALQRPTHLYVRPAGEAEFLAERTVYGESLENPGETNHRGQVYQVYDGAGVVASEGYDFKGNLLRSHRQLLQNYREQVDWSASPVLEEKEWQTSTQYDALNRPIQVTSPDNSVARPVYNEANLLEQVRVRLRDPSAAETLFVRNIDYNAKGQRTLIEYGNGVKTEYTYDPETFRLTNLLTRRMSDSARLQDFHYTYDPVGNITSIQDDAQQTVFFAGEVVTPNAKYTYDALYRLIKAEGREHRGQTANNRPEDRPALKPQYDFNDSTRKNLPHPHDATAMRNYTQTYQYDQVGNILAMIHRANGSSWTRAYEYAETSNRLRRTSLPENDWGNYDYDAHGSMIDMPHLTLMQWDFKDQLQASSKQVDNGGTPEITYYVYDASGQRVRKVTERRAAAGATPTRKNERIYLGGFELYREFNGTGTEPKKERETLHVMDGQQRIALVEALTIETEDGVTIEFDSPKPISRYQLSNHLGSACVELDEDAAVISYEEYHPYGTTAYQGMKGVAEVSLKRYRYTGMERDEETGLGYHTARYYAPWLGRWCSADPIDVEDGNNLYRFVQNNTIVHSDRNGNQDEDEIAQFGDIEEYRSQRRAVRGSGNIRLSEHEHISAFVNLQLQTLNQDLETSPVTQAEYRRMATLTIPEDMARIKTAIDLALRDELIAAKRSGEISEQLLDLLGPEGDIRRTLIAREATILARRRQSAAVDISDLRAITEERIEEAVHLQWSEVFESGRVQRSPLTSDVNTDRYIDEEIRAIEEGSPQRQGQHAGSGLSGESREISEEFVEAASERGRGRRRILHGLLYGLPVIGILLAQPDIAEARERGEHTRANLMTIGLVIDPVDWTVTLYDITASAIEEGGQDPDRAERRLQILDRMY